MEYIFNKSSLYVDGFDITTDYYEWEKMNFKQNLDEKYDTIYFMHSFAHIDNAENVLRGLRKNLERGGKIIIITPNLRWMDTGWISDETVVEHYHLESLQEVVKGAGYEIDTIGQFGKVKKNIYQYNRMNCERLFLVAK